MSMKKYIAEAGRTDAFLDLLDRAGLGPLLEGDEQVTVLVPTDQAFRAVDPEWMEALKESPDLAKRVVELHVAHGRWDARRIAGAASWKTISGHEHDVDTGEGLRVGNARVTDVDFRGENGIVHLCDRPLLTRALRKRLARGAHGDGTRDAQDLPQGQREDAEHEEPPPSNGHIRNAKRAAGTYIVSSLFITRDSDDVRNVSIRAVYPSSPDGDPSDAATVNLGETLFARWWVA